MQARLQQRIQRYGWDLAAGDYEPLWRSQLAAGQSALLGAAALLPGERVLDVACGTGLVTFEAARAVGAEGHVMGTDLSDRMIAAAIARAAADNVTNVSFERMDAEALALPDAGFDVALCALGLMYMPDPHRALREMRRVLRRGGRAGCVVWGARATCGWAPVFEIVDAEVASDVCPLFFRLGAAGNVLADACAEAGFTRVESQRLDTTLVYADGDAACDAALVGGPVALAWARFDADVRLRVRQRYLEAIARWRIGTGYHVPASFVIAVAV